MQKVSALALFLLISLSLHAQDGKFRGGIKINPVLGWLKTEVSDPDLQEIKNNGTKFGFSYGLVGEYAFGKNYAFAAELRVAHLGGSYTFSPDSGSDYTVQRDMALQFIEIPIGLKMMTNEIGYAKYFALFGFVPAINIKSKADMIETSSLGSDTKEDRNIGPNIYPVAAYLQIGAGMEYNLGGSTNLVFGITFNNGFTNLWQKSQTPTSLIPAGTINEDYSLKPANIALNVGVLF